MGGFELVKNKIEVTTSLDKLLGLGRFARLREGMYALTFFQGLASDISMIVEVLEDGALKTRTTELIWMGDSHDKTIYIENMSYEKVDKLIHDQFEISASLTRVCNDFLEKVLGELSEIEDSNVEGRIDLDYCKSIPFGSFEIEVRYTKCKYVCTVFSSFVEPHKFCTMDIDRVESVLCDLKKQYDAKIKDVLEEELSKFG